MVFFIICTLTFQFFNMVLEENLAAKWMRYWGYGVKYNPINQSMEENLMNHIQDLQKSCT